MHSVQVYMKHASHTTTEIYQTSTNRLLLLLLLLPLPLPLPLPLLCLYNGLFSRTTSVSQQQKGKTSLDLNEARDDGVFGYSGISWTICKQSAPHCRQTTTPTPHHSIFTDWMLFLMRNQQCQCTVALLHPSDEWTKMSHKGTVKVYRNTSSLNFYRPVMHCMHLNQTSTNRPHQ